VYRGEMDLALRLDEDLLQVSRERNDSRGLILRARHKINARFGG